MTDDIVTRLRRITAKPLGLVLDPPPHPLCKEAADEIERLRAELSDWQRTVRAHEAENERLVFERDEHRDAARAYKAEIERLRAALAELAELAMMDHDYCDDSWYSCPLAPDGCCNDSYPPGVCNCGADEHNAKVRAVLELGRCR